jgi:hypothetical protein
MSLVSMLALPAFFLAGRWFHRDKAKLEEARASSILTDAR